MRPEIKAAWLTALRGGLYSRTTGTLQDEEGYCCLGVLCDLAAQEKIGTWQNLDNPYYREFSCGDIDFRTDTLPLSVQIWAGLDSGNPQVGGHTLASWNDGTEPLQREYSFTEIADMIEREL